MRSRGDVVEREIRMRAQGIGATEGTLFAEAAQMSAPRDTPRNAPPTIRPLATGHIPAEQAQDREALKAYLTRHAEQIALELAQKRGPYGVTAGEVRYEGSRRGLWTNTQFDDRMWSFLAQMFPRLGLTKKPGMERPSPIPHSRNSHKVHVLAEFLEGAP